MATPDFQWLRMRIGEERERREKEVVLLDLLPRAATELHESLSLCLAAYNDAFGADLVEMQHDPSHARISVRDFECGQWLDRAQIEILTDPAIPGFQIDRAGSPLLVEVGILPGEKVIYRDRERDEYLSMEELTRRILDRSLFPKLAE